MSMRTNMIVPSDATVVWNGPTDNPNIIWIQSGKNVTIYFKALDQIFYLWNTKRNL
jgi:hypothetical protein